MMTSRCNGLLTTIEAIGMIARPEKIQKSRLLFFSTIFFALCCFSQMRTMWSFFLSIDRHSPLVVFFNHQKHILIGFWHPKTFYFSVDVEQNCFEWRDYYQDIFYFPIFFPESVMVATLLWLQLWHHLLWLCHYLCNMTFYFHFFIFYGRNTFFLT